MKQVSCVGGGVPIIKLERETLGDGADASGFWPKSALSYRYALPVNAQYVAAACAQSGVTVTLFKGSTSPETQTCSGSSTTPDKVYFGATSSGNNVSAVRLSF
jgi:hypothetical protein